MAYTVKKGDTPWSIAQASGLSLKELSALNNNMDVNKTIYAGQTLNVTKPTTSSATKTTSNASSSSGSSGTTSPSSNVLRGVSANTSANLAKYESPYTQSDAVNKSQAAYETARDAVNNYGTYQSSYADQLNEIYNKIMNREDFKYDLNNDMLYKQYKDQYTNLAKMGMMDTMGQAAALTGGYGNSYASTAGNQAYQSYLTQLNDKIPELYQLALDQYNQEGEDLYNQYSLAQTADDAAYGRWNDQYNRLSAAADTAYNVYSNDRSFDYGQYSDNRSYWNTKAGQENTDYWNQTNFDESVRQADRDYALQQAQLAETIRANKASEAEAAASRAQSSAAYKAKIAELQDEIEAQKRSIPRSTDNTRAFQAAVMTKQEFAGRRGSGAGAYKNYDEYISATLEKWYDSEQIDEGELSYLKGIYGVE